MKKLALDLDELRVDSFEVEKTEAPRGTVLAQGSSGPIGCQYQCVSEFNCQTFSSCNTGELSCQVSEYPGCGN